MALTSAWARGDPLAADLHELAGPADPLGEHVDVELVPLELLEDLLELADRVGVPRGRGLVVGHGAAPLSCCGSGAGSTRSTRVTAVPSANSTVRSLPGATAARRVRTRPSASRVIV